MTQSSSPDLTKWLETKTERNEKIVNLERKYKNATHWKEREAIWHQLVQLRNPPSAEQISEKINAEKNAKQQNKISHKGPLVGKLSETAKDREAREAREIKYLEIQKQRDAQRAHMESLISGNQND
jgi:hypothetical protein